MNGNFWLPPQSASTFSPHTDALFASLSLFFFLIALLVAAIIFVFSFRYRQGRRISRVNPPTSNPKLEALFISLNLVFGIFIFAWAAKDYLHMRAAPPEALEINVYPKQWMWKFQHSNGLREIDTVHVPKGQPVKFVMISQDVIHSLFIPDFRLKEDVLPGRYTSLWFTPTRVGRFQILCSQYCGTNHSTMRGEVVVLEPEDYERWLTNPGGTVPVASNSDTGAKLFSKLACISCHGTPENNAQGDSGATPATLGPSLVGLWKQPVRLSDGTTVVFDENYVRESILDPNAKIVKGYTGVMPTFRGLVSEEELGSLMEYIKSLSSKSAPGAMKAGL